MNRSQVVTAGISVFAVLCAAFTGYSFYRVHSADEVYKEAADTYETVSTEYTHFQEELSTLYEKAPITVDFTELQEQCTNGNVVGWLYCDDSKINYPVVCGTNNQFYLHHLVDGTENVSGTLFLDCKNHEDWTDGNNIIYGHHMADGSMFGGLSKYRHQDYAAEHPFMWLITPDCEYKLQYLGCYVTDTESKTFEISFDSDAAFQEYIDYSNKCFLYPTDCTMSTEDRFVSLITCSYESNNVRQCTLFRIMTEDELVIDFNAAEKAD